MTVGRPRKIASLVAVTAAMAAASFLLPKLFIADAPTPLAVPSADVLQEDAQGDAGSAACRIEPSLIGTVIVDSVQARSAPSPDAAVVATFGMSNEQGAPQVFLLEDRVSGADGTPWFHALLPVRPNGTRGYIPAADLRLAETPYRLVLDRRARTLTLWDRCDQVRTYPVGLGTKETPTPVGEFYLTSLLQPPSPDSVYGSYAYGLSGYSRVITDWTWGGLVGLHGTNDPSSVGELRSKGCIRMRNNHIEQLVEILPLGTPIEIS
jgi:lipoprotein-anchoring transpeptidase ErfK/SrfK